MTEFHGKHAKCDRDTWVGTNCLLTSSHGFIVCSQRLDGSDNKQKLLATTLLGMAGGITFSQHRGWMVDQQDPFTPLLPKWVKGSVALLLHNTLKWSVILRLSFFARCWWHRESMLWGSSMLSEFHSSLSKVLTLWYCVKLKQRYHRAV